jgi:hypothetical protein
MPLKDSLRYWGIRVLLSLTTAGLVSASAFVCAWVKYREGDPNLAILLPEQNLGGMFDVSLWDFAFHLDTAGVRDTCILAGILAFPLFLVYSTELDGRRSSLIKVLVYNTVTLLIAVVTAAFLAVIHLPPIGDHH